MEITITNSLKEIVIDILTQIPSEANEYRCLTLPEAKAKIADMSLCTVACLAISNNYCHDDDTGEWYWGSTIDGEYRSWPEIKAMHNLTSTFKIT